MAGPTIWIPRRSAEEQAEQRRDNPLVCLTCRQRWPAHKQLRFEAHCVECSNAHEDEEREMSLRTHLGIFGGERAIPDLEDWVARNRQALLEGRKRL